MATRTLIVTGASRGIGRAVVTQAIQHLNCNVIGVARTQEPLAALAQDAAFKDRFKYVVGDVTDEETITAAVKLATSSWSGRLDGLVLNAGVIEPIASVADANVAEWKKHFDVNFFSLVTAITGSLPTLREFKGRIIMVSSGAAVRPCKGWAAYCTSKAAMNMLNECLASEEQDIVTVAVRPGVVDTDMQGTIRGQGAKGMRDQHARFVQLHETGALVKPEVPGYILANLAVSATPDLHGKFLSYDDPKISAQYGKN
ncbi:hypothetical protein BGZ73_002436 [Actinomortierella ambigua]|nr:hypothetical protein BGZ73_002436 [Actinomortierella ambigua]